MAVTTARTMPGVLELLPLDQVAFQSMLDAVRRNFERFGFLPVETPVMEYASVLLTKEGGETERRLYTVSAWRETPFFTPRERAALAWAESLTLLSQTHAPDEDFDALAAQFSPQEQVDLSVAIATINSWNRLAVGFRKMPQA